ncbi:MAG: DUF1573 domain-containing protein [Ferruginibacter sp.]
MKKFLLGAAALILSSSLMAQKKADDVAKFKSETIDMGKLEQSKPQTVVFVVTNIGKEPLIIEAANPTCGCTIGDYTKEPIAPGKNGEIKATYNAANLNAFEKHLTVKFAGVEEVKNITIKGEVLTSADYAKLKGSDAVPALKPAIKKTKTKTKSVAKN